MCSEGVEEPKIVEIKENGEERIDNPAENASESLVDKDEVIDQKWVDIWVSHLSADTRETGFWVSDKLEVAAIEKRGYGLLAAEDMEEGEVLIIEKASVTSMTYDGLVDAVMAKAEEDVVFRSRLHQMTSGEDQEMKLRAKPVLSGTLPINEEPISLLKVKKIIQHNHHQAEFPGIDGCFNTKRGARGIWPHVSLFNHSTEAVAATSTFFNDWMQVTTIRPIKAGEEIFVSYLPFNMPFEERREVLYSQHGFTEKSLSTDMNPAVLKAIINDFVELRQMMEKGIPTAKLLAALSMLSNRCYEKGFDPATVDIFAELGSAAEADGNLGLALEAYAMALEVGTIREPYSLFSCLMSAKIAYVAKLSGFLPAENTEMLVSVARRHHDTVIGAVPGLWEALNPSVCEA